MKQRCMVWEKERLGTLAANRDEFNHNASIQLRKTNWLGGWLQEIDGLRGDGYYRGEFNQNEKKKKAKACTHFPGRHNAYISVPDMSYGQRSVSYGHQSTPLVQKQDAVFLLKHLGEKTRAIPFTPFELDLLLQRDGYSKHPRIWIFDGVDGNSPRFRQTNCLNWRL